MSKTRKNIRGNNRLSRALNKPIEGKLGEKPSSTFVTVFAVLAIILFSWYFISQIGFKSGIIFTFIIIVIFLLSILKQKYLYSKKSKWKAFNKDK